MSLNCSFYTNIWLQKNTNWKLIPIIVADIYLSILCICHPSVYSRLYGINIQHLMLIFHKEKCCVLFVSQGKYQTLNVRSYWVQKNINWKIIQTLIAYIYVIIMCIYNNSIEYSLYEMNIQYSMLDLPRKNCLTK